jgi:signal transduction histidine kinase
MRRLYLQIYLTFVGILVLFSVLLGVAWLFIPHSAEELEVFEGVEAALGELLPGPDRPDAEMQAVLERLHKKLPLHLAVHGPQGRRRAAVGERLPAPRRDRTQSGWMRSRGAGTTVAVRLPGGRWLTARHGPHDWRFAGGWLGALALLALAIAVGAYPLVRRTTRRLERLQDRVDQLGAGDLAARVEAEGNDEVAELARSFNRAAAKIEKLVGAQRGLLASVSHELRSPLARIRVAIELLGADSKPELRDQVSKDIAELDDLIGEVLLASRLDTLDQLEQVEDVDLLALLAEEAARNDADVSGEALSVSGDRRMLRRLIRNLLQNSKRYGGGTAVEASVTTGEDGATILRVCDRGPGVPDAERERIFEPFYRSQGSSEREGGVGLGLSIVRQIARQHQGEARCLPRAGGGTCFEVSLPLGTPQR